MKQWWESDEVENPDATKRMRAIAYYRHSAQDRQENFIPIQRDQVRELADKNGVEIIHEFSDAGKSGLNSEDRPAFTEMMEEWECVTKRTDFADKNIGHLCARQRNLAVDDKERNAVNPIPLYLLPSFPESTNALIATQSGLSTFSVHTSFDNYIYERLLIANISTFCEIRLEQRVYDFILDTIFVRQPDELVGVEGVRCPLHPVKVKLNAFLLANCNNVGIEFNRAFPTSEFPDPIFPSANAFFRHRWI